jgi:catechol 2,3-dioxygenase-like lactoylglutathione lyase family enzyme
MTEQPVKPRIVPRWYTRPVLFVSDIERSLQFYVEMLGFEKRWHEGDGAGKVCQVDRGGCEIILCEDPTRRDKGRLFVALSDDPDGNELLFPTSD